MINSIKKGYLIQDIDLKLLRVFATIVQSNGFSAAQYTLNQSLPTISASMTQLEQRLGFKLCERGRSGFRLTEGGKIVYKELSKLMISLEEFQSSLQSFKQDVYGHVTIALDDAILTNFRCPLYKILRNYSESSLELKLNIEIMTLPEMENALLENKINIAVGPFREISDALQSDFLYDERQFLCCGKGHAAFGISDQDELEKIIANSGYILRSIRYEQEIIDSDKFSHTVNTTNMEASLALILSGQCIGYLARHACENWIEEEEIWVLGKETYSYDVPNFVVFKKSHGDPRIDHFLKSMSAFSAQ